MQPDRPPTTPSRAVLLGLAGLSSAGLLAAGAYWAGTLSADNSRTPAGTRPAPVPVTAPPPPAAAATTPTAAGLQWLQASHTPTWTDPAPGAWADRALPLTTGPAQQEAAAARGGSGGADWDQLVSGRCSQHLGGLGAVVPPEAPRTADTIYVQLTGTVSQTCAAGAPPAPWTVTATVETHRANDGTWRVNQQLQ